MFINLVLANEDSPYLFGVYANEKWQLKGFEEVGKKVEKSTKIKAISNFE